MNSVVTVVELSVAIKGKLRSDAGDRFLAIRDDTSVAMRVPLTPLPVAMMGDTSVAMRVSLTRFP